MLFFIVYIGMIFGCFSCVVILVFCRNFFWEVGCDVIEGWICLSVIF